MAIPFGAATATRLSQTTLVERLKPLRYARIRHILKLLPAIASPSMPPSIAAQCCFAHLDKYVPQREKLGALLSLSPDGNPFPSGSLQHFIDAHSAASGSIGIPDLLFLHAFVSVVEIGTLSGFSAAIILDAAERAHPTNLGVILDTIDLSEYCINNAHQRVGYQIGDLVPHLKDRARVHAGKDARVLPQLALPNEFDVAFIDADHQHPRPLLDLLRVASFVRQNGWLLLHDIALPAIAKSHGLTGEAPAGAQWLFDLWPFPKISGGNIGAVQLPARLRQLARFAMEMLLLPNEVGDEAGERAARAVAAAAAALT